MTIDEWREALAEVARDSEAAPGPRVKALELLGRDLGYIKQHRPRGIWWRLLDRFMPEDPTTPKEDEPTLDEYRRRKAEVTTP